MALVGKLVGRPVASASIVYTEKLDEAVIVDGDGRTAWSIFAGSVQSSGETKNAGFRG